MITAQVFEHPATTPLVERLTPLAPESGFQIETQSKADVEWSLLEMVVDTAIISPIGYAESILDVQLLHGACIAAYGATDSLNLYFKPGLHNIRNVICIDVSQSDTVLAGIILREKYRMTPTFTSAKTTLENALQAADAVLVQSPRTETAAATVLDIVDEWWDMMQLPYVQFVIAGWKHRMTKEFDDAVSRAGSEADTGAIQAMKDRLKGTLTDDPVHQIPGHYRYTFDEEALLGLNEYYRLAFFHGLHKDIPDVAFWLEEQAPEEPVS